MRKSISVVLCIVSIVCMLITVVGCINDDVLESEIVETETEVVEAIKIPENRIRPTSYVVLSESDIVLDDIQIEFLATYEPEPVVEDPPVVVAATPAPTPAPAPVEIQPATEPETVPETEPETEPVTEPETEPVTKPEKETEAETEAETEPETDPETEVETEAPATTISDDQYLLAYVIWHEAGNQPYEGMQAVGIVVMNRVRSGSFPNTVYNVINQPGQFFSLSVAFAQSNYDWLPQGCKDAASYALAGNVYAGNIDMSNMYFFASGARAYGEIHIGGHYFRSSYR